MSLKPEIRPVDIFPLDNEGQKLILLRDPQNLSDKQVTVTLSAYLIVTNMNGANTLEEIRVLFNDTYKADITPEDIQKLVKSLDDSYLLKNEKFINRTKELIEEFENSPVRESCLSGKSYSDDAEALSKELDGYLDGKESGSKPPVAIIAPHIDLRIGGKAFGAAFSQLKGSEAETFVVLGIGHTLASDFFACVNKDFKTPLGVSPVDGDFLARLEEDFGEPIFNNAFAHKSEHSVELQVLFLQKLFGGEKPPRKIVPILLSFPETIEEFKHPVFNKQRIDKFISALQKGIERMGKKVCLIGGIDLSHVGRRFGETAGAPEARLKEIEYEDKVILGFVADGLKEEFVKYMKKVNPQNHVCGFPALYVLMDLMDGHKGELLEYMQNVEGKNESVVSFTAMRFG